MDNLEKAVEILEEDPKLEFFLFSASKARNTLSIDNNISQETLHHCIYTAMKNDPLFKEAVESVLLRIATENKRLN